MYVHYTSLADVCSSVVLRLLTEPERNGALERACIFTKTDEQQQH